MKAIVAVTAALCLGAFAITAPASAQQGDVLAPARAGQLQCYTPDQVRKTCRALASYRLRPDGSYENQATVLVAQQPFIVMSTSSPVTVRNGAVCGPLAREHLQAAQFAINGQRASAEDAAYLREQLAQMPGFLGDEICTTYTPSGEGFRADITVNGAAHGGEGSTVIWVRPEDGYSVAP